MNEIKGVEETSLKEKKMTNSKEFFTKKTLKKKKSRIRLSKLKYKEKIIQIKRVTKVVKGGKKLTFRAVVIVGDEKRRVGVGVGKADDVNLALEKAVLNGKKNIITIPLTTSASITNLIHSSYGASEIVLRPAAIGTGVIAGGSVRTVLELAGIKNVLAKQFGSKNLLNNAKATICALTKLTEKVEISSYQSSQKRKFYSRILKAFKNNY